MGNLERQDQLFAFGIKTKTRPSLEAAIAKHASSDADVETTRASHEWRALRALFARPGVFLVSHHANHYAPVYALRERREENANDLLAQARTDGIELAGWSLGAALVAELEREEFAPSARHNVIDQADVGGQPLWLRAENAYDAKQADALVAILARGMTQA